MPTFVYRVKTRQGGVRQGELEAVDHGAALRALRQQDLFVTRIREKPGFSTEGWSFPGTARVSQNDLLVLTYQLEALIKAGVPLAQSLDMLATQASSSALQAVMCKICKSPVFTIVILLNNHSVPRLVTLQASPPSTQGFPGKQATRPPFTFPNSPIPSVCFESYFLPHGPLKVPISP